MNAIVASSTIILTVAAALGLGVAISYVTIYGLLNTMRPARIAERGVQLKDAQARVRG